MNFLAGAVPAVGHPEVGSGQPLEAHREQGEKHIPSLGQIDKIGNLQDGVPL